MFDLSYATLKEKHAQELVYTLQRWLESELARLLAVCRVVEENQDKDTASVDGVKSPDL